MSATVTINPCPRCAELEAEVTWLKEQMQARGWVDGEEYPPNHSECPHYRDADCALTAGDCALEGMGPECDCDLDDHHFCYRIPRAEIERLKEALRLANEDAQRFADAIGTADCTSISCKEEDCYDCPVTEAVRAHEARVKGGAG